MKIMIDYFQNNLKGELSCQDDFDQLVAGVKKFHRQMPGYKPTPLILLSSLAGKLGLKSIYIKDEAQRMGLKAFKVLGGSYAICKVIGQKLGWHDVPDFRQLALGSVKNKLGPLVFATATDGNHGKGVAYVAAQLGYRSEIYVHSATVKDRIQAIKEVGGNVKVIDGNYDEAVRQMARDADRNNWIIISDTSWEGYTTVPRWVMEGYYTLLEEVREQAPDMPTHIFIQGGVGTLPGAVVSYFRNRFRAGSPLIAIVEPEHAACLYHSAESGDGKPHGLRGDLDTMMAGLACGEPNPLAWEVLGKGADFFIKAADSVAAEGMKAYYHPTGTDQRIISGESGAVTLGVLKEIMQNPDYAQIKSSMKLHEDATVLLLNTEGDTDPANFQAIVNN